MSTTINPVQSGGPLDDDYGPIFPASAGRGMGYNALVRLRESRDPNLSAAPKVNPKKFIKAAEGDKTSGKKKVKKGKKPENLRASEAKNKKRGAFGETYAAPKDKGKGVRVTEAAPPGWEGTVKHMKKHKDIDNPFALAWHMKNQGDTPHH